MKKLCLVLLALVLVFCIAACGDKEPPDVPDDSDAAADTTGEYVTPVISPDSAIPFDGYRIVRADTSEQSITDAAVTLRKALMAATGSMTELTTDWSAAKEPEIMVGDTNRGKADGYKLNEYRILCEGKNIFILGGSAGAVAEGVQYFIDNLICENGFLVCDGYKYESGGSAAIGKFSIGGVEINKVFVYAGEGQESYAKNVANMVFDLVGIASNETETISLANIYFTNSDPAIEKGNWGIVGNEGQLVIVTNTDLELNSAYNKLIEILKSANGDLDLSGVIVSEHQRTKEEFYASTKELVIYPEYPEEIRRIYDYDVTVSMDGKSSKIPVYNHVVESNVTRRPGADMYRRFSAFAFCGGQVRVDIKVKKDFKSYTVFPAAKNFKHDFKDGVISVYLDKPDYFGIQLDEDQNSILSVFADYPEFPDELPSKDDPSVLYIDSWYETENGLLDINEDYKTVYVAPGAVLNCRVKINGSHCKVFGRGAIVDPFEDIYNYDIRVGGTEGSGYKMLIVGGSYNYVDGLTTIDARCFNYLLGGSENSMSNCKALSAMMTTDGITGTGKNISAEHCWLYVGDNGIVFSANGANFKDVTIGTTCAALFPQGSPTNCYLEDINIFRSDDGLISYRYNPQKDDGTWKHQTASVTIKNLSAVELPTGKEGASTSSSHFFQGANMGELEKTFVFENISVVNAAPALNFRNDPDDCPTENFKLTFKNYSNNSEPFTEVDQLSVSNPKKADNTYSLTYDKGFKPVIRNQKTVNYTAPNKVFVGKLQVYLSADPKTEGGKTLLRAEDICKILRVKNTFTDEFVSTDDLKNKGIIDSVSTSGGVINITPSYKGANLFATDEGEVSYFAENVCYCLDLVVSSDRDGYIYTVYENPKQKSASAGISRRAFDEFKMYGTGTYRLKFSAMSPDGGSLAVKLSAGTTISRSIGAGDDWSNFSFDFNVTDEMLKAENIVFAFTSDNSRIVPEFAFRDFSLTKIN